MYRRVIFLHRSRFCQTRVPLAEQSPIIGHSLLWKPVNHLFRTYSPTCFSQHRRQPPFAENQFAPGGLGMLQAGFPSRSGSDAPFSGDPMNCRRGSMRAARTVSHARPCGNRDQMTSHCWKSGKPSDSLACNFAWSSNTRPALESPTPKT